MSRPTWALLLAPSFFLAAGPLAAQATPAGDLTGPGIVAPSQLRLASGRPGPGYWQQRADYKIDVTLDPATEAVRGVERITYTNNAPEALTELWLHLEQNICAPGSTATVLDQPPLVFLSSAFDFSCKGFVGGDSLLSVKVDSATARYVVTGTTMRIDLARPLASGATTRIDITWRFKVPPYGAGRMGHDGTLYELGQWYPRMAVYDDVSGWNHDPYIGAGEFYLEYGRFEVALTIPSTYVVAATGVLLNPDDVLTAAQRRRLAQARRSDTAIAIITAAEAGTPAGRPTMLRLPGAGPGPVRNVTRRFSAE